MAQPLLLAETAPAALCAEVLKKGDFSGAWDAACVWVERAAGPSWPQRR